MSKRQLPERPSNDLPPQIKVESGPSNRSAYVVLRKTGSRLTVANVKFGFGSALNKSFPLSHFMVVEYDSSPDSPQMQSKCIGQAQFEFGLQLEDLVYKRMEEYPPMSGNNRIEINPKVMLGKPVIKGTRIPVDVVLRKLGEGATAKDLLDAYPPLKQEDILAALLYAADVLAHEEELTIASGANG